MLTGPIKRALTVLALILALGATALAQPGAPDIDAQIDREDSRLMDKVDSFHQQCGSDLSGMSDKCVSRLYDLTGEIGKQLALTSRSKDNFGGMMERHALAMLYDLWRVAERGPDGIWRVNGKQIRIQQEAGK